MILTAYLDESGTHEGSPVTIMGGFIGRVGQWQRFEIEWDHLLRRHDMPYLHSKDLFLDKKNWEKNASIFREAEKICEENTLFGFSAVMDNRDYDVIFAGENRPRKIPFDTKYGVCFRYCLSFLATTARRIIRTEDVDINLLLESGHKNSGDALRLFDIFKKQADPNLARLVKTIDFGPKQEVFALQAADMVVYASFQDEQKQPEYYDLPKLFSLQEAIEITKMNSPVFRLPLTQDVLADLKDNILSQNEIRMQYGKRKSINGN